MDLTVILGFAAVIGWAAVVFWGIGGILVSAIRGGGEWRGRHVGALAASAALSAGVVLSAKNALPSNAIGIGFVLALVGGAGLLAAAFAGKRADW